MAAIEVEKVIVIDIREIGVCDFPYSVHQLASRKSRPRITSVVSPSATMTGMLNERLDK